MYKTIMVPLDGSKRAENVLRHVEQLAHCYGAKVILLRVVNLPRIIGYESSELELFHKNFEEKLEEAEDYLNGLQGELSEKGIESRCRVILGPVVKGILDSAARENADLIAICSHGRGGLSRLFYGSVASGVLNRVDRPLLVIRTRRDAG